MNKKMIIMFIAFYSICYCNNIHKPPHIQHAQHHNILYFSANHNYKILSLKYLDKNYPLTVKPKGEIACKAPNCDGPAIKCTNNNSKCQVSGSDCQCFDNE